MHDDLSHAIRHRLEIEFTYGGLLRVVRPGALGVRRETKNPSLRGYQVAGRTSGGPIPGWRMFLTSGMVDLTLTDRHFADNPPDYTYDDDHLLPIFAQLEAPAPPPSRRGQP